jgi:uncharacterized glyoxalase superfamily protein PhnB
VAVAPAELVEQPPPHWVGDELHELEGRHPGVAGGHADHGRSIDLDASSRLDGLPRRAATRTVAAVTTFQRIAPIFAVRDLDAALEHYQRLGFATRTYSGGDYGFVNRDGFEIHLGLVPADRFQRGSAYLWVDDSDELAREWRAAGAEVHGPEDTPWGQHEAAFVDLDGNVIRFGTPIPPAASES